jgi:hypothetical protein
MRILSSFTLHQITINFCPKVYEVWVKSTYRSILKLRSILNCFSVELKMFRYNVPMEIHAILFGKCQNMFSFVKLKGHSAD